MIDVFLQLRGALALSGQFSYDVVFELLEDIGISSEAPNNLHNLDLGHSLNSCSSNQFLHDHAMFTDVLWPVVIFKFQFPTSIIRINHLVKFLSLPPIANLPITKFFLYYALPCLPSVTQLPLELIFSFSPQAYSDRILLTILKQLGLQIFVV